MCDLIIVWIARIVELGICDPMKSMRFYNLNFVVMKRMTLVSPWLLLVFLSLPLGWWDCRTPQDVCCKFKKNDSH